MRWVGCEYTYARTIVNSFVGAKRYRERQAWKRSGHVQLSASYGVKR